MIMGYESKLYIGYTSPYFSKNGCLFVAEIASIDVSCAGKMVKDCFSNRGGYYITEGNEDIFEDCYGQKLGYCELETLYNWLTHLEGDDANYRRFKLLKKLLEGFLENRSLWKEEIVVLEYGY